jgi:hypothetical protein
MKFSKNFNISPEQKFKGKVKRTKLRRCRRKVVIYSFIALGFLALTFLVDWLFIIGAVVFMILNQKELMKRK